MHNMSWQAGGPGEQVPVQIQSPEKHVRSMVCFLSQVWSGRLETQGELMFQPESEGRKKAGICVWKQSSRKNSVLLGRQSSFVFYSGLQLIGWQPHQGGPFALLNLLIKRLHSSKSALIETPRIMFNQISGFFVAQSGCPPILNITW